MPLESLIFLKLFKSLGVERKHTMRHSAAHFIPFLTSRGKKRMLFNHSASGLVFSQNYNLTTSW